MALGKSFKDIKYNKPVNESILDVKKALNMIGSVKNVNEADMTIDAVCRYGFQNVKLKIKIRQCEDGSMISVTAISNDIWSAGAKNCIKRFIETLENLNKPDYKPDKIGVKPLNMLLQLIGFIFLLCVAIVTLSVLPIGITGIIILIGLGLFIYFMVIKRR